MEQLHTVNEVAVILRVHPKTIYRWIEAGTMRAVRIGTRALRIKGSEVERRMEDATFPRGAGRDR